MMPARTVSAERSAHVMVAAVFFNFGGMIAQSSRTSPVPVIAWSIVLLAALVIGMAWAARLKRRFKADEANAGPPLGFTLSDLRQMHRAGQLSDAEFEKAKEKIVVAAKKATETPPPVDGIVERDSVDAIRARRLAREAQQQQQEADDETDGSKPS